MGIFFFRVDFSREAKMALFLVVGREEVGWKATLLSGIRPDASEWPQMAETSRLPVKLLRGCY
jgi:hypothetical protein